MHSQTTRSKSRSLINQALEANIPSNKTSKRKRPNFDKKTNKDIQESGFEIEIIDHSIENKAFLEKEAGSKGLGRLKRRFQRRIEGFKLKTRFCQVCFIEIDENSQDFIIKCSKCPRKAHSSCFSFDNRQKQEFVCPNCEEKLKKTENPLKKPRISCFLCGRSLKKAFICDIPKGNVHFSCAISNPGFLLQKPQFPMTFLRNQPKNNANSQEKIHCSLCKRKSPLNLLVKCEKCYEFAHFLCILQVSASGNSNWNVLLDLQPNPSLLKTLFSSIEAEFPAKLLEIIEEIGVFLGENHKNSSFDASEWLKNKLLELENSLFSRKGEFKAKIADFPNNKTIEKSQIKGFCNKHPLFSTFGCCSRSLKSNYTLNKSLKCAICIREFHYKCLQIKPEDEKTLKTCSECRDFLAKIENSENLINLDHIIVNSESGSSLCSFQAFLRIFFVHIEKIKTLMRKNEVFAEVRLILLGSSCFGSKFSIFCREILESFLYKEGIKDLIFIENQEFQRDIQITLPSIYENPELFIENEPKIKRILNFLSLLPQNQDFSSKIQEISNLYNWQKVFYQRKKGLKASLSELSSISDIKVLNKYEEVRFLELEIEAFKRKVLFIEDKFAKKEIELIGIRSEIEAFFNRKYEDSVFFNEFEDFIRNSISLLRKYWDSLFHKEEILGFIEEIQANGWEFDKKGGFLKRLSEELSKIVLFERNLAEKSDFLSKISWFSWILKERFMVFNENFEEISEIYLKYRLFRKRLEVFLVFDEKIDISSFIFKNSNCGYEDLYEYIDDVLDLSEIPYISLGRSPEKLELFELQSLETLESIIQEMESFLIEKTDFSIENQDIQFIEENNNRLSAELTKIQAFLIEKREKSQRLQVYFNNFLTKKPSKETLEAFSFNELKTFLRKSNVFLPIYQKLYAKKLEKNEIFFNSHINASKSSNEKAEKSEVLLISNYAREASQELIELLQLEKLNFSLLSSISLTHANFLRLKILDYPQETRIMGDFNQLKGFLEALKELFKEFKELDSMQEFLDFPNFALVFEKNFFKLELSLDFLRKIADNIKDFPLKLLKDQKIHEKILYFKAFLWLKEAESLASQTKARKIASIISLQVDLEALRRDFPETSAKILNSHYIFREFEGFSSRFNAWFSLYKLRILNPLAYNKPLSLEKHEDFAVFLKDLLFLKKETKDLNLEFEIANKRINDFEILAKESEKTGILLAKMKEGSGIAIEQMKIANEFARNCKLSELFPFFAQSKETSCFYQNMLQEIVDIKKVFNEKKLKYSRFIVLQLHCKDKNMVFNENVAFNLTLYEDFMRKVKTKENVEEMLQILAKNRFNIRNYKELLKQSFQITESIQENLKTLIFTKTLNTLDFGNAMEYLSEIVALRNELIRKPVFFCQEIVLFSCFEWSFAAKSLLEGLITYKSNSSEKKQEISNEKPLNELLIWKETLEKGISLINLYKTMDSEAIKTEISNIVAYISNIEIRISQLEALREPIKLMRTFQHFLLENSDIFFDQILNNGFINKNSQTRDFLNKRQTFLEKTPDFHLIIRSLLETGISVEEDIEFLKDLQRKSEELARSMAIITQTVRKSVIGSLYRALPSDLVINVFRSLYSSPFKSLKSEDLLNKLINLIRMFKSRISLLQENHCDSVKILRFYEKNPIFIKEIEVFLSDLQEFDYCKKELLAFQETISSIKPNIEENDCELIEIQEDEIEEFGFSWEDCENLARKVYKRPFYRYIEEFDNVGKELWTRKIKIIEQISFNKRPKVFFQINRSDLKGLLAESEKYSAIFKNDENLRKNMAFLKRFIAKVSTEILRIARLIANNRENITIIKESSQIFAKCVDISNEIQRIIEMSETELKLFLNKSDPSDFLNDLSDEKEAFIEKNEKKPIEEMKNDEKPENMKNFKTFQSIFNKNPAKIGIPAKRGRPNQKKALEEKMAEKVLSEEKQGEIEKNEEILEIFKSRREERGNIGQIEKERARSIELLMEYLQKNVYLPEDFNFKWVATRLETQIFKKFNEISEKYRKNMIDLMDILEDLTKKEAFSLEMLGDEKNVNLDDLIANKEENESLIKVDKDGKKEKMEKKEKKEKNPQEMEEEYEEFSENEDEFEGLLNKIKEVFASNSEVLLIEEEEPLIS